MKNQKHTHHRNKDPKIHQRFRWARTYITDDCNRDVVWDRIRYTLTHELPDGRVVCSREVFGATEPRRILARRLRYIKMVLLRRVREEWLK